MSLITALILARLAYYVSVSVLFGAALFPFYALGMRAVEAYRRLLWLAWVLRGAALLAVVSGVLWLVVAAADMSGTLGGAFDFSTFAMLASETDFGRLWLLRLALAVGIAAVTFARPSSASITGIVAGSVILLLSLVGTGHASIDNDAATTAHVFADAIHIFAAAVWIGALIAFVMMLIAARRGREDVQLLRDALVRFSHAGEMTVAALLFTGLINPNVLTSFSRTLYGQVLLLKLALFAAMLLLATANRFLLTPRLEKVLASEAARPERAIRALSFSILAETALAVLVFATVAWLGILSPRAALP